MSLDEQLRELLVQLRDERVNYALIGGLAMNVHARPRATADIDLLVAASDHDLLCRLLKRLSYVVLDDRPELASFVRGGQRVDALFATGQHAKEFLTESRLIEGVDGLRVVTPEALIALKLQAFNDDPRRLQDLADIMGLVEHNKDALDVERLRGYFEIFQRLELFDELFAQ